MAWVFQWGITNGIKAYLNKKYETWIVLPVMDWPGEDVKKLREVDFDTPYDNDKAGGVWDPKLLGNDKFLIFIMFQ